MNKKIIVCFLSAFIIFSSSLNSFAISPTVLMSTIYAIGKVVATSTKVIIDAEGILSLGYQVYNYMTPEQQEDLKEEDLYTNNGEYVISEDFYNKVNEYSQGKTINMNYNIITNLPIKVDYSPQRIQLNNCHLTSVAVPYFDENIKGNPLHRTYIYSNGLKFELYSVALYTTNIDRPIFYSCLKIGDTYTPISSSGWCDYTDNMFLQHQFLSLNGKIYFSVKVFNSNNSQILNVSTINGPYFGVSDGVNTTFNPSLINKDNLDSKFNYSDIEDFNGLYPDLQLRPKEELDSSTPPGDNDPGDNDPGDNDPGNSPIISNPPSFPNLGEFDFSGLQLDPLTNLFSNFKNKFPFSLPFDLANLIGGLAQDPIPPVFEADLFGETMTLDLTQFTELPNILKMFTILAYLVSLILITKKFGG